MRRWGLTLTPAQTSVFAALMAWRDRVCRAEDESTGYVLPKAQLVALAQAMPGRGPVGRGGVHSSGCGGFLVMGLCACEAPQVSVA